LDPVLLPTLFDVLDLLANRSGLVTLDDLNVKRRMTKRRFAEIGRVLEGFQVAHRDDFSLVPDADLERFVECWEVADLDCINAFFRRYRPYDKFLRFLEKEKRIYVPPKKEAKTEHTVGPELRRNAGLLLFSTKFRFQNDLDNSNISKDLRKEFKDNGISLSQTVEVRKIRTKKRDSKWLLTDEDNDQRYIIREERDKLNICAELTFVAVDTFKWWGMAVGYVYLSHIGDRNIYWGGERPDLGTFEDNLLRCYFQIRPLDGFANVGHIADRVCRELKIAFIRFENLFAQLCLRQSGKYITTTSLARLPTSKSPVQTVLPRSQARQIADSLRLGKPIEWTDKRFIENGVFVGGQSVKMVKIQSEVIK
jgi:hypothetical protein